MNEKHAIRRVLVGALVVGVVMLVGFTVNNSQHNDGAVDGGNVLPATPEGLRALELSYLESAMDPSLFDVALLELAGIENVSTSSDEGGPFLALRLYPNQPKKNNGVRSELSIDYPYQQGETVRYTWQFRVPEGFPNDAPENRWWVLADWHDQPDKTKGETWETYDGIGQSAPIIFGYGFLDGKDQVSFTYGTNHRPIGTFPFTKGEWHTITIEVTWSQGSSGKAVVYVDEAVEPAFSVSGPNMLNAYQHYMKLGMYRHPDIALDNTIHIRQVRITKAQ